MKRLSIGLPAIALALVLALSGAALTPRPNAIGNKTSSSLAPSTTRQIMYYFYSMPYDQYNDYTDVNDEMWEWEMLLGGVSINQNPVGGTCLAEGYYNNTYPHNNFPAVYIYAHYVY
jgi:hypothetical protein